MDLKHLGFVNNGKPFNDSLFLSLKSAPDIHSVHLKNKKFFFNKVCMYGFFFNSNTIKAKQTIMDSNFNRIVFLLESHIKNKENL